MKRQPSRLARNGRSPARSAFRSHADCGCCTEREGFRRKRLPMLLAGSLLVGWMGQPVCDADANKSLPTTYDAKGKRDPFVALVRDGRIVMAQPGGRGAGEYGLTPVLGGILWDAGGNSLALINDTEVRMGGVINGEYRVTAIRKDAVVLLHEASGEEVVLTITFEEADTTVSPPMSGAKRR